MTDERTKRVACMLTPETHAAFKIACVKLGTTMGQVLEDAARETIVLASLTPAAMGKGEDHEMPSV